MKRSIAFLLVAILFGTVLQLSAQEREVEFEGLEIPETPARGMIEHLLREKIKVTPEQLATAPTVGELRQILEERDHKMSGESTSAGAATDVRVTQSEYPESEVHAAINPTDSSNIVISPIEQGIVGQNAFILCPVYFTRDFGKTWKKSTFTTLPQNNNLVLVGGGDPILVFDDNGRLYISWIYIYLNAKQDSAYSGMFYAWSDDGGETWTKPVEDQIALSGSAGPFPISLLMLNPINDKQWMAADRYSESWKGRIYTAYVELSSTGTTTSRIVVRRYLPESERFVNVSVPVSGAEFNLVQFSSIDVDREGGVHVSFFGESKSRGWGVFHSRSSNGGESFSEPVQVSKVRFGQTRFGGLSSEKIVGIDTGRLYPHPQIVVDRSDPESAGVVYATWTGLGVTSNVGTGFDVYLSRSTDLGATWSTPQVVNDDGGKGNQFYSSIRTNDLGVVALSWYDQRDDPSGGSKTDYRVATSHDFGETFTPSVSASSVASDFNSIGSQNRNFGIGEYTQVLMTDGYVIPVWADGRKGNGDLDIYASFIPYSLSGVERGMVDSRVNTITGSLFVESAQPNRTSGEMVKVEYSVTRPATFSVSLFNTNGENIRKLVDEMSVQPTSDRIEIDVVGLPSGRYFVQFNENGRISTTSFTVQR